MPPAELGAVCWFCAADWWGVMMIWQVRDQLSQQQLAGNAPNSHNAFRKTLFRDEEELEATTSGLRSSIGIASETSCKSRLGGREWVGSIQPGQSEPEDLLLETSERPSKYEGTRWRCSRRHLARASEIPREPRQHLESNERRQKRLDVAKKFLEQHVPKVCACVYMALAGGGGVVPQPQGRLACRKWNLPRARSLGLTLPC
jgi:hypothetical protein